MPKPRTIKRLENEHGRTKLTIYVSPVFLALALPLSFIPAISGYTWIVIGVTAFYNLMELGHMTFLKKEMKGMLPEGRERTKLEYRWVRDHLLCAGLTAALALLVALLVPALKIYAWIVCGGLICVGLWDWINLARLNSELKSQS